MSRAPDRLQTSGGHSLAYEKIAGTSPGVVFLHGLNSDRHGNKANALATYCQSRGYGFLRYDMYGHGDSSGKFEEGGPSRWRDDAARVLDELTDGPQILVGSSMGGWVMTLAALARPKRIAGLIGIAAAPDFTDGMTSTALTAEQRDTFAREGVVELPSDYDMPPMRISRHLVDDGNKNLVLGGPIAIECSVRLLHGQQDADVPWARSMMLAENITGADVEVTLIKDGDHRLSRDRDLDLLTQVLDRLVTQVRA